MDLLKNLLLNHIIIKIKLRFIFLNHKRLIQLTQIFFTFFQELHTREKEREQSRKILYTRNIEEFRMTFLVRCFFAVIFNLCNYRLLALTLELQQRNEKRASPSRCNGRCYYYEATRQRTCGDQRWLLHILLVYNALFQLVKSKIGSFKKKTCSRTMLIIVYVMYRIIVYVDRIPLVCQTLTNIIIWKFFFV